MTILYGIHNCDTIKKARTWLTEHNVEYQFHDFRKDGIDKELIMQWVKTQGYEALVNKRSTTWRALDDKQKTSIDEPSAIALMLAQPTLIKRPVLVTNDALTIGFKADQYTALFNI